VEDNGVGNEKLLVAGSDEGSEMICERMRYMSENEK